MSKRPTTKTSLFQNKTRLLLNNNAPETRGVDSNSNVNYNSYKVRKLKSSRKNVHKPSARPTVNMTVNSLPERRVLSKPTDPIRVPKPYQRQSDPRLLNDNSDQRGDFPSRPNTFQNYAIVRPVPIRISDIDPMKSHDFELRNCQYKSYTNKPSRLVTPSIRPKIQYARSNYGSNYETINQVVRHPPQNACNPNTTSTNLFTKLPDANTCNSQFPTNFLNTKDDSNFNNKNYELGNFSSFSKEKTNSENYIFIRYRKQDCHTESVSSKNTETSVKNKLESIEEVLQRIHDILFSSLTLNNSVDWNESLTVMKVRIWYEFLFQTIHLLCIL